MPEPEGIDPKNVTAEEKEGLFRASEFNRIGSSYALEHATKPSTIGLVLATNPLALLIWYVNLYLWHDFTHYHRIGEKFLDWTDITPPLDTILESVTLYWLTETFPSSIYPYRQVINRQPLSLWDLLTLHQLFTPGNVGAHENPVWHIKKPLGFSWFPKEIAPIPQSWVKKTGNLVFHRHHSHVRIPLGNTEEIN